MLASSAAPTIAVRSAQELTRLLLEPRLGPAPIDLNEEDPKPKDQAQRDETLSWKTYQWKMRTVWLQNILLHQPKRWLPEKYPNYEELLTAAVEAAMNEPEAPKELASWRWGAYNAIEINHPVLGQIPLIRRWAGPGVREQSGSRYTVKAVRRNHGPSERFTANLADLDQSTLNTVTGQGGNFLSPYYMDQWNAWLQGSTFTLPFTAQAVDTTASHRLVLEPAR
jgi:penicillin amidase